MAAKYTLAPNESMIMKEESVAHGGVMAIYTDELMLTTQNIVCISKGMFGNAKNVFVYPLNQIKRFNGKPQVMTGKLSNGTATLDVYLMNGSVESFNFQTGNKKTISKWIAEITKLLGGGDVTAVEDDDEYDPNTLVGAFKEVGNQFRDALGFKPVAKKFSTPVQERITKKCISCSAPLNGIKGQVVHCKYCDTDQTL